MELEGCETLDLARVLTLVSKYAIVFRPPRFESLVSRESFEWELAAVDKKPHFC
jgi:hypothetical protein